MRCNHFSKWIRPRQAFLQRWHMLRWLSIFHWNIHSMALYSCITAIFIEIFIPGSRAKWHQVKNLKVLDIDRNGPNNVLKHFLKRLPTLLGYFTRIAGDYDHIIAHICHDPNITYNGDSDSNIHFRVSTKRSSDEKP